MKYQGDKAITTIRSLIETSDQKMLLSNLTEAYDDRQRFAIYILSVSSRNLYTLI
jgi:hypothetical protein